MAAMFEASNADSPTNSKLFCVGFIGEHVSQTLYLQYPRRGVLGLLHECFDG